MAVGYFGLYRGAVLRGGDPEARGRLLLQVPSVTGFRQTNWAESSHPAGFPALEPQPGDPVWVQFEGGDTMRPVWTGIPGASSFDGGGAASVAFDTLTAGVLTVTGTATLPGGYVTLTTTQTITGAKTFAAAIVAPNVVYGVTAAGNLASSGGQNPAISMTPTPVFTSATIPTLTGAVNTTGNLSEAGVRVYSASNPQPVIPPSASTAMMLMGA